MSETSSLTIRIKASFGDLVDLWFPQFERNTYSEYEPSFVHSPIKMTSSLNMAATTTIPLNDMAEDDEEYDFLPPAPRRVASLDRLRMHNQRKSHDGCCDGDYEDASCTSSTAGIFSDEDDDEDDYEEEQEKDSKKRARDEDE